MNKLFKPLTITDAGIYRRWAREHYTLLEPIDGTWHVVVQLECVRMNAAVHSELPLESYEGNPSER